MLHFLKSFFGGNFMAHGYCFLWKSELVWLHAGSDFLIGVAYYSIPLLLLYFVRRRCDVPFQGIFLLFSAFILSCGTGHLIEIITLWYPVYWLSGLTKAITAVVSLYTASELVPLIPKALALPSPAQLEAANIALEKEIAEHKQTVKALQQSQQKLSLLNEELEQRVEVRTRELARANDELQAEILEHRLAESALWESETRLHIVVTQAPIILYTSDHQGSLTLLKGRGLERLAHESGQFPAKLDPTQCCSWLKISDYLPDVLVGSDRAWIVQVGNSVYQNRATPLRDTQGRVTGLIGVATDITQRYHAEEALRRSEAQLREQATELEEALYQLKQAELQLIQTEKMYSLGMMVAGIAHEINNPVSFVCGNIAPAESYFQELLELIHLYQQHYPHPIPSIQQYTDSIDLDFLMEDLPNLLTSMRVGAERIRDLVVSLRSFSRVDEAKMTRVNLHEGLDTTLLILQHRLKEKAGRAAIEVVKNYSSLPQIQCYAGQLNQVFMNILVNAIDALESQRVSSEQAGEAKIVSQPSPRIQILTELVESRDSNSDSSSVVIRIIDNGPGMTDRVRFLLFDPFFTTKPIGQGTGLGLSISYQIIVAKHGGKLHCNSAPGQGSEFIIQIPVQQTNPTSASHPKLASELQVLSDKNRPVCKNQQQYLEIENNSCDSTFLVSCRAFQSPKLDGQDDHSRMSKMPISQKINKFESDILHSWLQQSDP